MSTAAHPSTALPRAAAPRAAIVERSALNRLRSLATSGVAWGFLVSALLAAWILLSLNGRSYYSTTLGVRAYSPEHRLLRPSGPAGQSFGLAGALLMVVPFAYMARKRMKRHGGGSLGAWLEVHLFCGIVGPVLVTFHTTFKFNGIISAAYWSMVLVMLSGFVGRYLYVRIPRSIRGTELTRTELEGQAIELKEQLADFVPAGGMLQRIEAFERRIVPPTAEELSMFDLLFGELVLGRRLRAFDAELQRAGVGDDVRGEVTRLAFDRALLLRRSVYIQRTKKLFDLWHVFHLPLVYLLLAITAAHVALALYMGYVPFRW